MKKLYQKNEITFAVLWIVIYIAGTSLAEALSEVTGLFKLFPALFHFFLTVFTLAWLRKNGLTEKYGLFLPKYRLARAWFFLPLIAVCSYKLCFSPALRYSPADAALFVISMLCVGFLEEIIFRGFLFRAMEKENLTRAITVSSITFGLGHIVNLFGSQKVSDTLIQIAFAVAAGFTLVILFHKGKSMIPCIAFHSIFNALSVIANDEAMYRALGGEVSSSLILLGAGTLLLGGYTLWNLKHLHE